MISFLIFTQVLAIQQLTDSIFYSQTNASTSFVYKPSKADSENYIFFELRIFNHDEGQSQLLMACSLNSIPTQLSEGDDYYIDAMYADLNANYENLTYHYILIDPIAQKYNQNDSFYLTIFIPNNENYQYKISVSSNNFPPCPNNCTNQANACKSGVCDCQQGYLNIDCSKNGLELKLNQQDSILVNGFSYLYYQANENSSKFSLQFTQQQKVQISQSEIFVYLMIEDLVYGVPNQRYSSVTKKMSSTNLSFTFDAVEIKFIPQLQRFQRILITIYSTQIQLLQVQIQISSQQQQDDTRMRILYICGGIALLIVLIVICWLFRWRQSQINRISQNKVMNISQQLNVEIINRYMPSYQYSQLSTISQFKGKQTNTKQSDQCTVCLLEFDQNSSVRYCPCLHIFHSDCLVQWLLKHESCPNCRLTVNQTELIKYQKDQQNHQDFDQKIIGSVQINPDQQYLKRS